MMNRGEQHIDFKGLSPNTGVSLVLIMLFASMSPFFASADVAEEEKIVHWEPCRF